MKARKGYTKGMIRDNSRSKYPDDSYYSLKNFKVVTDGGNSTGSLENERGHVLSFVVPNLAEATYADDVNSYTIPAQADLRIIGWGTLNDTIVVITTNETSEAPTGGVAQIWAFEYDEATSTIVDINPNNELNPTVHLKYNNVLNMSSHYRVARIIGRYENASTQRIYWTDNFNPVRTLNIASDKSLTTPPDSVDLNPGVSLTQPVIWDVGNGGLPAGTSIQFTYRLLNSSGGRTIFAPPSPIVPLNETGYKVTGLQNFNGNGVPSQLLRSVTVRIEGIDTNYDVIEYYAIHYSAFGVATVYLFDEGKVPLTGAVDKECTTLDGAEIIPLVEYNMLSSGFEIAKDIEVKDNLLIAANTKGISSEFDFDSRVYRYNSSRLARLLDANPNKNITLSGVDDTFVTDDTLDTGTIATIPEEHDAVNPYNTDNQGPVEWATNRQYKFQKDGTTLGGEGTNISYKFVEHKTQAYTNIPLTSATQLDPPHIVVTRNPIGATPLNHNIINKDGAVQTYNIDQQFLNGASFTHHCYFAGHSRGEVYRYGIVFYTKKASTGFTKWIGDIRIPEIDEPGSVKFPLQDRISPSGATTQYPWLKSIGIEFSVDVSSIADQITGFSFVRVLRDEVNKSRLGTGMLMWFETRFANDTSSFIPYGEEEGDIMSNYLITSGNPPTRSSTSRLQVFGMSEDRHFIVRDYPKWGYYSDTNILGEPKKRCVTHLVSPLGVQSPVSFKAGDYIRTTGYYKAFCHRYGDFFSMSALDLNKMTFGFEYRMFDYVEKDHASELFELLHAESLGIGEVKGGGLFKTIMTGTLGLSDNVANAGFGVESGIGLTYNTWTPFSIGNKKLAMLLSNSPSNAWSQNPATAVQWVDHTTSGTAEFSIPRWAPGQGRSLIPVTFKEVSYARYLTNQYGGNTYEDRSVNKYYFIGHYQPLVNGITSYVNKCFHGDVYTNYYDSEILAPYNDHEDVPGQPYNEIDNTKNKMSTVVMCPVESHGINLEFRPQGDQWSKTRKGNGGLTSVDYPQSATDFNFAYSNYDFVTEKFFAKDFLINLTEEHPNRIWASNNKINGELIDSWRIFDPNEYTEVNGVQGPINRIINWKESLYFYQDKGVGKVAINERSIINDDSGTELVLGTGGVLSDYSYLSTEVGSYHQFGIAASTQAIYHYDARLKKIFSLSGEGLQPISDIKGMSSFFDKDINGAILKSDKTLTTLGIGPIGVEAIPDYRYNRVLFTFLNAKAARILTPLTTYNVGDIIYNGSGEYYNVLIGFSTNDSEKPTMPPSSVSFVKTGNNGLTVSYNEFIGAFESFYDYVPSMYLQYGRRLLSVSPLDVNEAYVHNIGNFCTYYGRDPFPSTIETTLGTNGDFVKVFNNLEFYGQVNDTNGLDISDETFNRIRLYNDYQDTGTINLINNIKRRMRTWRYTIPRDNSGAKARLRGQWTNLVLEYDNANNKQHIVHDIIYSFVPTAL